MRAKRVPVPVADGSEDIETVGHGITSQAPGTALEFALTLVERPYGKVKRNELAAQMAVG